MKLKVDTGADICVVNTDDLQDIPFPVDIKKDDSLLEGYGPGSIKNIGVTDLEVTFRDKSIDTKFNIVQAPGKPSMIGCAQAQQLGIITVNIDDIQSNSTPDNPAKQAAAQGKLTKGLILKEYGDCFDKIGRFPGEKYHIQLVEDAVPVIHAPRTVAVHILPLYKAELDKMIEQGVIVPVTEPTEWVNSIVCHVTDKPDGSKKVRLCLDPKDLNKNIKRGHYYSKTIDEILPLLHGSKKISAGDTNKGYYHVELDYESSLLCTFNTPFGRFRSTRLPFGVKIAQDIFQRRLDEILKDVPNAAGIADDIEHDQSFINMLETCRRNNVSLNSEKLQFKQEKVSFYGHTLTDQGLQPADDKLQAIKNMKVPDNAAELLTLLGMINYLNRFSVKLAEFTAPLRELTKKGVHYRWKPHHQTALDRIKNELDSTRILSYYDPNPTTTTILQCDASQVGLGAWIRQEHNGEEKKVAMASRALTDTERKYSNIERECLAVVCNKFQPEQPKLPLMQPDLPTRPMEKLGTDIFEFKGMKYLMTVDYYSRFPVIRLLSDMTADTICNHFTSVLAEYGLPSTIIADFGTQYISTKFKNSCTNSGITLTFSSPYHHQANSLAERAIGSCKSLWKKAVEGSKCPYTAVWMYRVTPLDNNMPSPFELLFGRKPKTLMPTSKKTLQSQHKDSIVHQEENHLKQQRQAEVYDKKAGTDKRILNNMEPVYVRNTLKKIWEPGVVLNRPNPVREPRTYTVDIKGKVYYRTREHLKPRSDNVSVPKTVDEPLGEPIPEFIPVPTTTVVPSVSEPKPSIPSDKHATPVKSPAVKVKSPDKATYVKQILEPRSVTTRSGRTTKVPAKFKD